VAIGAAGFALGIGVGTTLPRLWPAVELAPWLSPSGILFFAAPQTAHEPLWFYPLALYREHFWLLPLTLFGLPALLRRTRPHAVIALALVFAAVLGLIVVSLGGFTVAGYELAVVPLLYLCAGTSLSELEADAPRFRPANVTTVQATIML